VALGGGLGGHQDVDLAVRPWLRSSAWLRARRTPCPRRTPPAARRGTGRGPPPPPRSTPGPMETRLSLAPQCGQAAGLGIEKPVRWQTRRPV
jgi:hypothetical protein